MRRPLPTSARCSVSRTEAAPRFATPRDPTRKTLGRKVGKVMAAIDPVRRVDGGRGPMPAQQEILDVACEIDPATGLYFYRKVVVVIVRQAGKTSLSRGKITHRALTQPRSSILYTAQDRNMARRRLEKSFLEPLEASPLAPFLAPAAPGRSRAGWDGTNGREKVKFSNASEIFIIAAQKKTAGHGDTLPEAHLDEYFAHTDTRLEQAVSPTMITVGGAQRWILSAAGDGDSTALWAEVEAGRARCESGQHGRTAYFEWSAPPDADRADPATWLATHPAIGYTIDLDDIRAEFDGGVTADEFDRAYLGWWPSAKGKPWIIPQGAWRECGIDADEADWDGEPTWTVDVAPERDWASVGLAGDIPGAQAWLENVAHEPGTDWVVSHLVKLRSMFGGELVALDGTGPAGSLQPALEEAGFTVRRLSAREVIDACGAIYDAALAGVIRHGNDPDVDQALKTAAKRGSGDAWRWVRGRSLDDITPLYAMTLALYVHVANARRRYNALDSILGGEGTSDDPEAPTAAH